MTAPMQYRYEGEEEWRTIPSAPAYSASSLGRVRRDAITRAGFGAVRHPSGKPLSQRALPHGHLQVTISMGNQPRTMLVHRLVAEAFLPPQPVGKVCVCHKDDDPSNNRPANLFWGSKADNSADMVRKGRSVRGTRVTGSRLTEMAVRDIRARLKNGEYQRDIAALYGVSQSNISAIARGHTWSYLP